MPNNRARCITSVQTRRSIPPFTAMLQAGSCTAQAASEPRASASGIPRHLPHCASTSGFRNPTGGASRAVLCLAVDFYLRSQEIEVATEIGLRHYTPGYAASSWIIRHDLVAGPLTAARPGGRSHGIRAPETIRGCDCSSCATMNRIQHHYERPLFRGLGPRW